ncbi:hypothetical protein [Alicyclobacillus sp. SO9]|uniref:hypothetical protein n=1 Tax=Alicyclobacillus sp. SO9 TaxID=2665646 RepID=UPI0018E80CC5|nr:hypothetical protein [Alicyclobacillus sp. SO9]QQE79080.1 hypothetical protein GI364_00715 [Alicyclobacillus sp. SO9]
MSFKKRRKRTTIPILSSVLFLAGCAVVLTTAVTHKTVSPQRDVKSMPGSPTAGHSHFRIAAYDGDSDKTHSPSDTDEFVLDKPATAKLAPNSAPSQSSQSHAAKPNLKPKIVLLFRLHTTKNLQGVTAYGNHVYAGFDMGHGKGEIREYTMSGQLVKNSGLLPIGHSASLSYNQANGLIYVTNGGGTHSTKIAEVNMSLKHPRVVKTINLGSFGHSGLVAVDSVHQRLWVHTAANDHAPITFRYCTMSGKVLKKFTIHNLGVPQGLLVYSGRLYYYTDNTITVLSEQGKILRTFHVHLGGESEGLALVHGTQPYLVLGFHGPNRYYALKNFTS